MNIWYNLWRLCASGCYSLLTDGAIVHGVENYQSGPKIIVANHPSAIDYFLAPHILPERFSLVMSPDLFRLPLLGWLHTAVGHVPVGDSSPDKAIDLARGKLAQGSSIVMSLEGRLTPDGNFARPRVGAAVLALEAQVPIMPCGIYVPPSFIRTLRFQLYGRERVGKVQLGGPCIVQIGKAWIPPVSTEKHRDWATLHQIARELMTMIGDLVKQGEESYIALRVARQRGAAIT